MVSIGKSVSMLAAFVAALGACAVSARACTPAHQFTTVAAGKLTVAIYEYPPFTYASKDGQISGVDSDILKKVAEAECLVLSPLVVDPAATIQYVLAGKADIAAGDWYRTAARAKVLGLAAPTYLDQMAIYSKDGLSSITSMQGKQIGTVQGFLWVSDLQKVFGAALHLYPNPVALAQDLQVGRIDVGVDSYGTGIIAQKKGGYPGIKIMVVQPDTRVAASGQAAQAGFPYTKSNEGLGKALDAAIVDLHKSGGLAKILQTYGLDPSGADVGAPRLVQ